VAAHGCSTECPLPALYCLPGPLIPELHTLGLLIPGPPHSAGPVAFKGLITFFLMLAPRPSFLTPLLHYA